jgi:hypothetical protein
MMMMRVLWIGLGLLLVACAGNEAAAPPRAEMITCHTAYRSSVGVPIEREQSVVFTDVDGQESISFEDLVFHAQYGSGEMNQERALRLWVTDVREATELQTQLYQLQQETGPQNQFVGGHGFTGLNYVYHPSSGAELQFWCVAG